MRYQIGQLNKRAQQAWQNIRGNVITAYWWNDHVNFGDLITPALLKSYGLTPQFQEAAKAELVSTGSILQRLPQNFSGIVLGSGLVEDKPVPLPQARFLAVRGELSRDRAGAPPDVALGDPGLLAYRLLSKTPRKSHKVAVIPHYADKNNAALGQWINAHTNDALLVDVERRPKAVIKDIARCECVASSSLHGIITAHALGIPAVWLRMSDQLKGGDFKFRDYASALDMQLATIDLDPMPPMNCIIAAATLPGAAILETRQKALDAIFRSIAQDFRT